MKILKWILGILAALLLLFFFVGMPYLKDQTKKHSPERTSTYNQNGFDLTVNYSSPFKKGRVIFGELIPYDQVWRTGANEPTVFETKTDISLMNKVIPAGKYSMWTIPGKTSWTLILNDEIPDWGVTISSGGRETTRDSEHDVLEVNIPVEVLDNVEESFTIDFEKTDQLYLRLYWDTMRIKAPINNN
ncbi:MAG: DUF2911 domain-containing protein [Flavobacteriaceae bacterium]